MATNGARSGQHQLGDILQQLGSDAKDIIVYCLQHQGDVKNARLVSRSFRDIVDSSILRLSVTMREEDVDLWTVDRMPPLQRFTRCGKLTIQLEDSLQGEEEVITRLLCLLLVGQSMETKQRVTRLSIRDSLFVPGVALRSLLLSLPSLRKVSLHSGAGYGWADRMLVFDALASLPQLEELRLPPCRALDDLGRLRDSLKRLAITRGLPDELDAAMVDAIASLTRLEELTIDCQRNHQVYLYPLLRRMPASVRVLVLPTCRYLHGTVMFWMADGRVNSVSVSYASLSRFLPFVSGLLDQAGLSEGQPVERFCLHELSVTTDDCEEFNDAQLQPLRALAQRCSDMSVSIVNVDVGVPAQVVQALLPHLGRVTELRLPLIPTRYEELHVAIGGYLTAAADGEAPATPGTHAWGPHPPPSLAQLALERMLATAAAADGVAAAGGGGAAAGDAAARGVVAAGSEAAARSSAAAATGETAANAAASGMVSCGVDAAGASRGNAAATGAAAPAQPAAPWPLNGGGSAVIAVAAAAPAGTAHDEEALQLPSVREANVGTGGEVAEAAGQAAGSTGIRHRLLLLHGPLLAAVAWVPGHLDVWVEQLAQQAEAMAGPRPLSSRGREKAHLKDFLALPRVAAVLVRSHSEAGTAALMAAAAEAREAAAAAGLAAVHAAAGVPASLLHVQVLQVAAAAPGARSGKIDMARALSDALRQVGQSVWDGVAAFASGWSAQRRLQWLLEQWEQLGDLEAVPLTA